VDESNADYERRKACEARMAVQAMGAAK
jgi:hypothetical protein